MSVRRTPSRGAILLGRRATLALMLLLVLAGFPVSGSAAPTARLNAAGLVIRHGDGSVLYFYVQFSESEITGTQLLERAGVSIDVTPYPGIGQAVCRIDGEGCPSSNCFCKSYANPSVYWRYHKLSQDGTWVTLPYGPDQRTIHDGDVDGWSWSARDNDLPAVSLSRIAGINGVSLAATPSPPGLSTAPPASPATLSQPTRQPQAASPVALGVDVQPSGQISVVAPIVERQSGDNRGYVWFGVGVSVALLVGAMAVLRRRGSGR